MGSRGQGYLGSQAKVIDAFKPSSYASDLSATTTVTGQSVAIASDAARIRFKNKDATNFVSVAFGTSASDAETNAANGIEISAGEVEFLGVPELATHFAYLGDTGTVVVNATQGV